MNRRTRRKKHQRDLMHEAVGSELRLKSRIKRGEVKPTAGHLHSHCGCGSSGCCGCIPIEKKPAPTAKKSKLQESEEDTARYEQKFGKP